MVPDTKVGTSIVGGVNEFANYSIDKPYLWMLVRFLVSEYSKAGLWKLGEVLMYYPAPS